MSMRPSRSTADGPVHARGRRSSRRRRAAGVYIPHLCYHPEFKPHGSCKLCTVEVERPPDGVVHAARRSRHGRRERHRRAQRRAPGADADAVRRGQPLLPVLREERRLQAAGDRLRPRHDVAALRPLFSRPPGRRSHPELLLDFNRCILCSLCVRASRDVDGKNVFALSGRGIRTRLIVNAKSGRLADTDIARGRQGGARLPGGRHPAQAQGIRRAARRRRFDLKPISGVRRRIGEDRPAVT